MGLALTAVVGPTASGKTELGLELAERLNAEIISADSRQMYRYLDAGTAKPEGAWETLSDSNRVSTQGSVHSDPTEEKIFCVRKIPYHLVDILDPKERTDAGQFAALAEKALEEIYARGKRAILVGGTGLYLRALLEGLDPLPPRNPAIREELAELVEANGREWLHEELSRVDPEAARKIPPNNLHRIVRALEVYKITGRPISNLWTGTKSHTCESANPHPPLSLKGEGFRTSSQTLYIGIQWDRTALIERIEGRCRSMFPKMLEEVSRLVPSRYTGREPGFQSLGYPETLRALSGEITRDQALALMIKNTVAYAKRQATWFKHQAAVQWIPAGDGDATAWADYVIESMNRSCSLGT